ncbi:hypothetical protein [Actinomadura roseirufa]|uniref:hypothetical protein n=1 Tax=Actinomadura roseirufa TaxID=2094049 RepID=UPI001040F331|nr:hypothetical protein [Actinomadura roseirufa]
MYETLMPHGIGGGRASAAARRRFLAERVGASTSTLDAARRELLAPAPDGPYLSRSTPRGAKRSVLHAALRRPRETGERYAAVPAWTLDVVHAGRRRPPGTISPEAWRLHATVVDRAGRDGGRETFETTVARLGATLNASPATGRRRLAELEAAGLIEATERRGGWLSLRVSPTPDRASEAAQHFARHGRRRTELPPTARTPVLAALRHLPQPLAPRCTNSPACPGTLVNIARLLIRTRDVNGAHHLLNALFHALRAHGDAVIDGRSVSFRHLTNTEEDHRTLCQGCGRYCSPTAPAP